MTPPNVPKLPPRPVSSIRAPTKAEMTKMTTPEDDDMKRKVSPGTYLTGVWGGEHPTTPSYSFDHPGYANS